MRTVPLWQSSRSSRYHTLEAVREVGSIFITVPPEECPQPTKTYPSRNTGVREFCGDLGTKGADQTSAPFSTFTPITDLCVKVMS